MKQIIIVLLTITVLFLGYNIYRNYERFHYAGANYVCSQKIDKNYHDQSVVINYQQAIADANSYVKSSWSNDDVDVRNPEDKDKQTNAIVSNYSKKVAIIKLYEDKLAQSAKMKSEGLTDKDVINFEKSGFESKNYKDFIVKNFLTESFKNNPEKYSLKVGDYSSFIFELQKILVEKGYNIPVDGIFKDITAKAISEFERKNNLFPDGKLDQLTLNYLLQ